MLEEVAFALAFDALVAIFAALVDEVPTTAANQRDLRKTVATCYLNNYIFSKVTVFFHKKPYFQCP